MGFLLPRCGRDVLGLPGVGMQRPTFKLLLMMAKVVGMSTFVLKSQRVKRWLFSFAGLRGNMKKRIAGLLVLTTLLLCAGLSLFSDEPWFETKSYRFGRLFPSSHYTGDTSAPPTSGPVSQILLMTYGRSGSSFTSQVLQRDPRVFYSFEPLHNLLKRHMTKLQTTATMFAKANRQELLKLDQKSVELIEIFLYCGFESLNATDINNFQLRNSEDSRHLWTCVQASKRNPVEIVNCFLGARKTCLTRPVRMVKTIRLRGTAARTILGKHKDVKILYLVRDPRGALSSQLRIFHAFEWRDVHNFSADYCQVFREDLAIMGQLVRRYPSRVRVVRYERLAENPLQVSEEMYSFLGLRFSSQVKAFVYNRTMAGQVPNNAYGTLRSNSTETAYSWRSKVSLESAQIVDRNCRDVYQTLGYLPVHSDLELLDRAYSLKRPVTFQGWRL
ncbi:hypothetical protein ACOMHN_039254 [Nucella lapillus]